MSAETTPPEAENPRTGPDIDRRMLEALICPVTHGPLSYDSSAGELVSTTAGLAFPLRDGIPVMLLSEARKL